MRELAVSYSLPGDFINKMGLQKLSVSLTARNLLYVYKTIPNVDAESALGTDSWVEDSAYPSPVSVGFGLNVSF